MIGDIFLLAGLLALGSALAYLILPDVGHYESCNCDECKYYVSDP